MCRMMSRKRGLYKNDDENVSKKLTFNQRSKTSVTIMTSPRVVTITTAGSRLNYLPSDFKNIFSRSLVILSFIRFRYLSVSGDV